MLGEFGDDPRRYASGKARRNYAGTSPITRASGKRKIVVARYVRNDRLIDALMIQAFAALRVSPGARAFYDTQRAKGIEHNDALGRLASRLVGILHGCLKTRTSYDEATAWGHRETSLNLQPPLDIQTPGMSWLGRRGSRLGVRSYGAAGSLGRSARDHHVRALVSRELRNNADAFISLAIEIATLRTCRRRRLVSRVMDAADHALGGGQLAFRARGAASALHEWRDYGHPASSSTTAARRGRKVAARAVSVMGAGGFSKG